LHRIPQVNTGRSNLVEVTPSVPELLERLRGGDQAALNQLVTALYAELHRIAARHLRGERTGHTLQATALVHEAYLKLFDGGTQRFTGEVHFLAVASRVMRQVLVDYARARATQKRGGGDPASWTASLEVEGESGAELLDLIALDGALDALAAEDDSLARLVEMRYFGGMTAEETAEALGISVHVVRHDLRLAQAWLRRKLSQT
jgi:RNA polymerase sigma factor (TIGR02999 family)